MGQSFCLGRLVALYEGGRIGEVWILLPLFPITNDVKPSFCAADGDVKQIRLVRSPALCSRAARVSTENKNHYVGFFAL